MVADDIYDVFLLIGEYVAYFYELAGSGVEVCVLNVYKY